MESKKKPKPTRIQILFSSAQKFKPVFTTQVIFFDILFDTFDNYLFHLILRGKQKKSLSQPRKQILFSPLFIIGTKYSVLVYPCLKLRFDEIKMARVTSFCQKKHYIF